MVLLVHLVKTEGWVHFVVGARVSTYILYCDRFVCLQATCNTKQLSVNVSKSLKPYYMLISFDQCVVSQSPLDATVFVAYGDMPYNPDWLVE